MQERQFIIPEFTTAQEIKNVRKKLGLTQKEFAQLANCSKATIERWETSKEKITGPIVLMLQLLLENIDYVQQVRLPKKIFPLRLWYMHKDKLCTLIEVDELNRQIRIKNYTDNVMFRAFGVVEEPDFNIYMEFLESRCFPKTRDKMKLVLKDLDVPFYDPLLIIEKTEGRMAEDDFWIRIER